MHIAANNTKKTALYDFANNKYVKSSAVETYDLSTALEMTIVI